MSGGYIGINGIAKRLAGIYVGDNNNVARKVVRGYVGDENGVARLFYTVGNAHIHSYIQSEITFDDTVNTAQHTYTKTCSSCGKSVTVWDNHNYETITKAATCTVAGYNKDVCEACGRVESYVEIPKTGHTSQYKAGYSATCTESGRTSGYVCSTCSTTLSGRDYIAPKGHTEVTYEGRPATCEYTGLTDGKYCSTCNEVTVKQEVIPATGHTKQVILSAIAPTCTTAGRTESANCSVCKKELSISEPIPATGHIYSQNAVPATCTEDAYDTAICVKCGYEDTSKRAIYYGTALGHNYVGTVTKEATCGDSGVRTYKCSRCSSSYTETIPATGNHKTNAASPNYCIVCGLAKAEW